VKASGIKRINNAARQCRREIETGLAELDQATAAARSFLQALDAFAISDSPVEPVPAQLTAVDVTAILADDAKWLESVLPSPDEAANDRKLQSSIASKIAGKLGSR
jgi:hypothetical protein